MMGSRTFNTLFRAFLMVSLLASLLLSNAPRPATAAHPGGTAPKDSPAGSATLAPQAASGLDLIHIPPVVGIPSPKVDGTCDPTEYMGEPGYPFVDSNGISAVVYLVHDGTWLYACMVGALGTNPTRFASLYLDPQGNGASYTYAQQDDFALHLPIPGALGSGSSFIGTGVGNYTPASPTVNTYWDGVATVIPDKVDVAEYRLNLKNFNLTTPCSIFNLAVYHHWVDLPNGASDFGWPSNQWYDQPRTWQPAVLGGATCGSSGSVAYVFRGDMAAALSFYNLLNSAGYNVALVPLNTVLVTTFSVFDLIVIADDTGSLDQWGTPGQTASQVAKIANPSPGSPGVPIIGLGEGGYAFFGQLSLFIGWPQGWHGPQSQINQLSSTPPPFTGLFSGVTAAANPVTHYAAPTNSVGIYMQPLPLPLDVTAFGGENPPDDHASLILQGCRMLWGNSGAPYAMTADGRIILLNTVDYMRRFQCPAPPPPPNPDCLSLVKSASPDPTAGQLPVGSAITYTLTYQIKNPVGANCPTSAKLVDQVPFGTTFAGSADGVTIPGADGLLTWLVTSSASPQTRVFKVLVGEAPCTANQLVSNFAELRPNPLSPGSPLSPLVSNTVTHSILCAPIGLPNEGPVFAEDELKVDPYPLLAGTNSLVSVRVTNLTAVSQPVSVQFQASPVGLGIGLSFVTFGNSSAALPAHGTAVLTARYAPALSGNQCIQALVGTPGMANPLVTQRCLDVTENLQPGVTDHLLVPVRNNTSGSSAIALVVDNTCPGWTASVTPATTGVLSPGASQTVDFSVTPPAVPAILGTGCHIDLQGWIGTTLIGGIRKLDLPPVHLPENIQPPWEEPEISFLPDPPVAGSPAQICIQLGNPLAGAKSVTVDFAVADFGAGIGFTPVGSQLFNLPGHSLNNYCIPWTPATSGTLHRCVLVTLHQAGFQDEYSQRNVDLRTPATSDLSSIIIPFIAGNPDLADHVVTFDRRLVGINPLWDVVFELGDGSVLPSPLTIPGGGQVALRLRFVTMAAAGGFAPQAPAPLMPDFYYGSEISLEVTLLLDGLPSGGFSLHLVPNRVYVAVIKK